MDQSLAQYSLSCIARSMVCKGPIYCLIYCAGGVKRRATILSRDQ